MSLTVSYVGLRGIHLWTEVEGNPTKPTSDVNGVVLVHADSRMRLKSSSDLPAESKLRFEHV